MVDVGAKGETNREAIASAAVRMSPATLALVLGDGGVGAQKGDVLATARVAAIAAVKKTSDLIPLCHPVRLVGSAVEIERDDALPGLSIARGSRWRRWWARRQRR
jgi:cyclic pyranopterin phosphate synthase